MPVTARHVTLVVGLALGFASPIVAQPAIAHLSQVEGTVTRLHRFAPAVASVGVVLVAGDQIVTAMGRAELTFVDGSVMHLDQHTQVAIAGTARIRLIEGRISLRTTTAYSVETATGIVEVSASARSISSELRRDLAEAAFGREGGPQGVFELTANATNRDVLVQVVEGDARIESPWGVESVRSTQTAFVSGPTGQPFVSRSIHRPHDSFIQWYSSRYVVIVPPPTFLPYAHPTYRQFAYERSLSKVRLDRNWRDVEIRGKHVVRGQRRNGRSASARQTSGELRRDRAGVSAVASPKVEAAAGREGAPRRRADTSKRADRDDRPRTPPPTAAPPSSPVRGTTKALRIRRP